MARQVGDQEHLCELLLNLGQAVFARGDYIQAMAYSQQALQLCRQIGYRYALTTLLINLGGMATEQKDYAQAEAYLQEALEIARQMENRNRIGVSLVNLGAAAMEQGIYAQAEAYPARSAGNRPPDWAALALMWSASHKRQPRPQDATL
ncbi:MAG TPA: hypothetical protein DCL75_04620 [Ktedonobacter sp.]|nr:hypothetical protein [Ktedonobacter sp.]